MMRNDESLEALNKPRLIALVKQEQGDVRRLRAMYIEQGNHKRQLEKQVAMLMGKLKDASREIRRLKDGARKINQGGTDSEDQRKGRERPHQLSE